jgi:hypothetical protein
MKLSVYVLGREVAALESVGDFKSVLTYLPGTSPEDFVSLTMPVRTDVLRLGRPVASDLPDESPGRLSTSGVAGAVWAADRR